MTELTWDGKYDKDGKRVAPLRVSLPFQTVETVNESVEERIKGDLFAERGEPAWRNRLIWGDKKYVLPSLLEESAGKVNLIYIDPPFNVGADFSFTATIPEAPNGDEDDTTAFVKEPGIIEQKAYRDTWGRGMDSYLQWFYETVVLLRELLADNGSIYAHLDWHVGHYAKVILDEVFGFGSFKSDNEPGFRNEIVWCYSGGGIPVNEFPRKHDVIFWYTKSNTWIFTKQFRPYSPGTIERGRTRVKGENAKLNPEGTPITDWWTDIKKITSPTDYEKLYYDTQKSEELLARIIKLATQAGDLVLDCFCGSGTTAAVAEKLGRRWIACDLSRFAVHTTRKRLLGISGLKPFQVQNLGTYERQVWQASEFGKENEARVLDYRRLILKLYGAKETMGPAWLHGVKRGRKVHVGAVDAPVSAGDVTAIVAEWKRLQGTGREAPETNGIDILGWDFAFELNEVARQEAARARVNVRFVRIPRDVMDKRAVEQGEISFFELAALAVEAKVEKLKLTLSLTEFVIPPDDVPADVAKAVTHWSQWIDFWAVDWDYKGDAFHNQWQTYRTRKERDLKLKASYTYEKTGEYAVGVKVIDILGNDTTRTIGVKVG